MDQQADGAPDATEQRDSHATPRRGGVASRLRNYFLAGILVTAPISITFWLVWRVISFVDNRVTPLIPERWNPETYLPFGVPGLGLIVAIVALTLVGFLAAGYIGRLLMRLSERLVAQVPVARGIYSWTKQVFETVLSQKTAAFNEVVMIEYPCRGVWAIGFITGRTEGEVQDLTRETVYNVFVPATPNPTTGFLLFIPERDVHRLDMTVEEGIKLVISGGIVTPATLARRATEETRSEDTASPDDAVAKPRMGVIRRLRNYFLAGILVTAPISITIWLTWEVVTYIDDRVTPFIPPAWNPETYLPFGLPGLGIVLIVVGLTLIGFVAAGLLGRTVIGAGERLLHRMPVIRSLYGAVKQVVETVFKEQSSAFREVVLIQYPRPESWAIGFVTGRTEGHVQELTPEQVVNVFLPTTPNPTSGFLLFVPRDEVQALGMTIEEGIKMVVSGGIVTPAARARKMESVSGPEEDRKPEIARSA